MTRKWQHLVWAAPILLCATYAIAATGAKKEVEAVPPRPLREFRGAWIATVANLDWPSKPGLSTADQKAELIALLDKAAQLHLNVIVFQVRPGCDVFYWSPFEPWSEFLMGQMGKAPEPYYDPLTFAVEEAHKRGLELHAWFNPFRVRAPNWKKTATSGNYVHRVHPEFVRTYGSQLWLDPGLPAVREHCLDVILDVVKRYDIDGVHLDDYFYPYPEKNGAGQRVDFPDESSWQQYSAAGGKLDRGDWRRKNIDDFIQALYSRVRAEKRWVKVGISPFGIWRPGFPKQVKKGLDAYDLIYADSRKWLTLGWVDYFAPQLYWAIDAPDQSFPALLNWWAAQNPLSRLLCPAVDTTKVGGPWQSIEIANQVRLTRKQPGANGNLFWNMSSLMRNSDRLGDTLSRAYYSQPALLPPCTWMESSLPAKPALHLKPSSNEKSLSVSWSDPGQESWLWLCQTRHKNQWTTRIFPRDKTSLQLRVAAAENLPDAIAVTGITRCGGAGPTALLDLKSASPKENATAERTELQRSISGEIPQH